MAGSPPIGRIVGSLLLLGLAVGWGGCAKRILARRIVEAPNIQYPAPLPKNAAAPSFLDQTYAQAWMLPVGPPPARLSIAVVEPGDYHLKYKSDFTRKPDQPGKVMDSYGLNSSWQLRAPGAPALPVRGTILLLHGIMESKENMMPWALYLAQRGYRAVLVDLRGHGRSTGAHWITFGVAEANDLRLVTDDLIRRGLAGPRVGLLARSYGASVGLIWAAHDPRVAAIVVLEPYSDPRRAITEFSRAFFPRETALVSDETFAEALARAQRLAGFDWRDADPLAAVRLIRVPILFFHGTEDTWVPIRNSEELKAAAAPGSVLVRMRDETHVSLALRLGSVAARASTWFDRHLAAGAP
jgi:pimeloyl-ACP methyl ester carboxylesterase